MEIFFKTKRKGWKWHLVGQGEKGTVFAYFLNSLRKTYGCNVEVN